MSEHDDDLPPELDVGPQLFKFRQISELKIASFTEKPPWKFVRTNALAVANEFGATFVGVPTGIKVLSSSSLLKSKSGDNSSQHEIASIALRKQPTWIDVSSDNLTLSVCCCSEEGIQVLYFDIRNILNKTKAVKTPFHQSFLSKSKDDTVTSLMWNPSKEFAHLLALTLSNGRLYVISVKDSNPTILKDDSIDASVVSWNVEGSILLVGKGDGALCQLNQSTYDMEQSVSVSNVIDGEVRTCDLLWISDCDVATVFTPSGDDDTPKLVLAKLPEKNKFSDIAWKDYDEPSSGFGESRPTQLYLKLIKDWDLFLYVSSNSNTVVIIAKNKTTSVWEIWNLEEYCRAAVPISRYNDEDSAAIGVSVITGHEGTQSVLAVFTDDCILCLFEMVNCMDGYPNIVNQVSVPDLKDERVAVKIQDPKISLPSSEQSAPTFQKQKLTAKPSVFSSIKPLGVPSTKPLGVPSTKPLGVPQGFSQIPKLALSKVTPVEKSSASMSTLFRSSSPLLSKAPPTQPVQNVLPASKQSKVAFLPSKSAIVSSGSDEPNAKSSMQEHTKSKIPSLSRQRDLPVKIKHQPDVKSTMREILEFEKELQQVQGMSEDTKKTVEKMLEQCKKPAKLQQLSQFQQEIRDTTADLEHEIEDLSTELFTLLSDAKQATQKKLLKSDRFYKEMMYNKPLNQTQRRQYSDLLNLYRYVVTSSQEANALLDYQWENDEGVGSSQKQGRKGKAREWESARQALVSNMKVFHDLQVKILRLSQQIDRLQISKRIALSETMAALSPRSNQFSGRSPRSPLLVSGDGDGPKNKGTAYGPDLLAPEKKLSALKQHKLGKVLAQRDNKRIIRADLSKTSILRSVNKTKSSESSVTASSESELANDGTTSPSTETEGQEYSETDESSEEPETTIKTAYGPPPISMTPQGSATLAYGAPKSLGHTSRPFSKPFNLAANEESKMNLNHPPQVVNIQNVTKPVYKGPPLMQKFEPKPDVPSGAVEVVQSVLETVKAEKAKPVPENLKFINQGKGEGVGEDVNERQPEPTTSIFQMKLPQPKSLFFSTDKAAPSPPPSYPFSTPLSKTLSQPEVSVFGKPHPKEPVSSEASTSQSLGLKLQTPSTKSIFNIAPSSSKPSGSNLFSGAPLFSSTPSVFGEASGLSRFSMERKTLFSAPSPVPTSTSETSSSNQSTPSDFAAPPLSSPVSVPTNMPATVMAQPPTPVPSSVPASDSPTVQSPSTPPIASSKPATPPVVVPSTTPSPILHTVAVSSSSPSTPIPAITSDATSSTEVTVTEQTQSQNTNEPEVATDPVPSTPEPELEPTPAIPSSTAPVLPSVTTASPPPPTTEAISVSDHPFGTSSAQSVPAHSDLGVKTSQSASSPFQAQTSSFNTGSIFSSSQSNPASTTGGFGGFGSLSVGDKPAIPGPSKNPFQTPFGAVSSTNEEKPSIFGQMSQTSVSSPFGSADKPSENASQSNPFGTPTTQSSFSSFASPTNSGVGSQGFGGFGKSSMGGFGGPAKFGGTPSFGSSSPFGSAPRTFGSGFGTSTFGTAAASDQNKGFAGFGSGGASSGFGAMTNQGGNSVFGNFGNQGSSTFGSVANQSGSSGFGALAAQGGSNQGASPFGGMTNQNTSSGFGAQPSQGNTSVFGSLGNQGNSTGFGGLASQGTASGFGGNTSVFGNNGNNQSGSTGFGAFGSQGGSSLGGFGGMQQNQSGGFGMKSDQSSSFSSWR